MPSKNDDEDEILPWIEALGDGLLEAKHKREEHSLSPTQEDTEEKLAHVFEQRLRRAKQQAHQRTLAGSSQQTPIQRTEPTPSPDSAETDNKPKESTLPWLGFLEQQLRDAKRRAKK